MKKDLLFVFFVLIASVASAQNRNINGTASSTTTQRNSLISNAVYSNVITRNGIRYCGCCGHPINDSYGPNGTGNCSTPMNSQAFNLELNKVKNQSTIAGKRLVARKIANNNCLTSQQVYLLCSALTLSTDKLEIAKFGYGRVFDPENYEVVFNAFPTSAMVDELNDFIKSSRTVEPDYTDKSGSGTTDEIYVPGYNGPYGCRRPMSATDFKAAKQSISDADFENTKLETAKTVASGNCLTSEQIAEMCRLFDFEATKLDFAKYAFSYTYDKGNYFKVNNVFDFDASKTTLTQFVRNGGK